MTEKVKRKLNGAASKMLAPITGRTPPRGPSPVKLRQSYSRDAFRIRIDTKMSKDGKLLSSNKSSLRCPHLSGGVAIM